MLYAFPLKQSAQLLVANKKAWLQYLSIIKIKIPNQAYLFIVAASVSKTACEASAQVSRSCTGFIRMPKRVALLRESGVIVLNTELVRCLKWVKRGL